MVTVIAIGGALRFLTILFSRLIRFHNTCLVGKHVRKRDGVIKVRRSVGILAASVAGLVRGEVRGLDNKTNIG